MIDVTPIPIDYSPPEAGRSPSNAGWKFALGFFVGVIVLLISVVVGDFVGQAGRIIVFGSAWIAAALMLLSIRWGALGFGIFIGMPVSFGGLFILMLMKFRCC